MLERLDEAVARAAVRSGSHRTRVPRQTVVRYDRSAPSVDMSYRTMLCVVTSGAKRPDDGTHRALGPGDVLLNVMTVPVVASFTAPYRSVVLEVDLSRVAQLDTDVVRSSTASAEVRAGALIASAQDDLLDAMDRWVRLLDTPEDIPVLAPRYEDEILYRVLRGPLGHHLRRATATDGEGDAIRRVVTDMARRYADRSLRIADFAEVAGMSSSAFFQQFRTRTGLSPLSYLKRIRMQRARTLLRQGVTASAAAAQVGYASAAHFSRDYTRRYGLSPLRHLRAEAGSDTAA